MDYTDRMDAHGFSFYKILRYVFTKLFKIFNIILQVIVELPDIYFCVHMDEYISKSCRWSIIEDIMGRRVKKEMWGSR